MKTLNSTTFLNHKVAVNTTWQIDNGPIKKSVHYKNIFDIIDESILFIGLKDGSFAVYAQDGSDVEKFPSFNDMSKYYGGINKEGEKLDEQNRQLIVDIFKYCGNNNVDIDNIYGSYL